MDHKPESKLLDDQKKVKILHEMIEMVTRQTSYTYEEAKIQLEENKWDYKIVIKKYMGIDTAAPTPTKQKTMNQEIFSQIRRTMDDAGSKYYNK